MLFIPDEARHRLRVGRLGGSLNTTRVHDLLRAAGLRPTRQRTALGGLLFRRGHRHVTADDLHQEATRAGAYLALATVYNTLNQFADAGLVRKVCINGERTYFDTDPDSHHHFYIEAEDRILDVPADQVSFGRLPEPPDGYEITDIDVVIRLMRRERAADGGPSQARDAGSKRRRATPNNASATASKWK